MDKRYEDLIPEIEELLSRYRTKWQLNSIAWLDYDDVSQIIDIKGEIVDLTLLKSCNEEELKSYAFPPYEGEAEVVEEAGSKGGKRKKTRRKKKSKTQKKKKRTRRKKRN
mgnify:CR=1 FL=1